MKTQKQRILEALRQWTSPADAFWQAGTMKLSTRVGELRAEGYDIISVWNPDRAYKLYRLRPAKPKSKWAK
jgi:hypothetical protein